MSLDKSRPLNRTEISRYAKLFQNYTSDVGGDHARFDGSHNIPLRPTTPEFGSSDCEEEEPFGNVSGTLLLFSLAVSHSQIKC